METISVKAFNWKSYRNAHLSFMTKARAEHTTTLRALQRLSYSINSFYKRLFLARDRRCRGCSEEMLALYADFLGGMFEDLCR